MSLLGRLTILVVSVLAIFVLPAVAFAQEAATQEAAGLLGGRMWAPLSAAFGAGAIIAGAAYGISRIGATAVESMARQPEAAGNIQTAMLVAAALIEGVTFFALIVLLVSLFRV